MNNYKELAKGLNKQMDSNSKQWHKVIQQHLFRKGFYLEYKEPIHNACDYQYLYRNKKGTITVKYISETINIFYSDNFIELNQIDYQEFVNHLDICIDNVNK